MYSIGVVLVELWKPFGSRMERAKYLEQLRQDPSSLKAEHLAKSPFRDTVVEIAVNLLQNEPAKRWNTTSQFTLLCLLYFVLAFLQNSLESFKSGASCWKLKFRQHSLCIPIHS